MVDVHTDCCRYEVRLKEQHHDHAKQNIKPVSIPYARFPADNVPLKDASKVLFNKNALESAETSTSQSQDTPQREVTHPSGPGHTASQPVTKQPPSSKLKDPPSSKPCKPPVSPKPSQKADPTPQEEQPIYEEPGKSPTGQFQEEEADNPVYGVTTREDVDNPVYGVTTREDVDNPVYGMTTREDDEEVDNPLYRKVR